VFRVDAEKRGPAEVFAGKLDEPGKEKGLLTAPRGLAVAGGLLYVADPGSNRVVAFKESDRSFAGEFSVENPQVIGVDPDNGAIYVCAHTGPQTADLIHFAEVRVRGLLWGKEAFRMKLPRTGQSPNAGVHRIAVDASAEPVRIWLPSIYGSPHRLHCIEFAGGKFVDRGDPRPNDLWAEGPRDITVDRVRGEVYVKANGNTTYRTCRWDRRRAAT
jgi:DNA-binding beta-propeller fold protein YncE